MYVLLSFFNIWTSESNFMLILWLLKASNYIDNDYNEFWLHNEFFRVRVVRIKYNI